MDGIVRLARMAVAMSLALGVSGVMLPLWLVRGLLLRKRPSKQWPNLLQYILTSVTRTTLGWQAFLGAQPGPYTHKPSAIEQWISASTFEWIKPAGRKSVQAGTGFDDTSLPVRLDAKEWTKDTAGLWYRNTQDLTPPTRRASPVVLYFHGGAYVTLDAGDPSMGLTNARNQAKYAKVDVLTVGYRLAPGSKHPSQLYEAYSTFCHLRRMGYQRIFIGGDSAGANLALTLWRYLDEVAHESNAVAGLLLFSPWLDMQGSKRKAFQAQISSCCVSPGYVNTGFRKMQTNGLPKADDGWISPTYWDTSLVARLPPLFVSHGGEETLVEEGQEFVRAAKKNGVDVTHFLLDGYPHDFQALPWYPSAIKSVFTEMGAFVHGQTA